MLFNPNWKKSKSAPKPAVNSLDGLIEWLEDQNPNRPYEYLSPTHCLLADYFRSHGYRDVIVGTCCVNHRFWGSRTVALPEIMNTVATKCDTYGKALRLAKTYKEYGNA